MNDTKEDLEKAVKDWQEGSDRWIISLRKKEQDLIEDLRGIRDQLAQGGMKEFEHTDRLGKEARIKRMLRGDVEDIVPAFMRVLDVLNAPDAPNLKPGRWRERLAREHVYTAITHAGFYLRGRRDEDHLAHAACRILLAMCSREK